LTFVNQRKTGNEMTRLLCATYLALLALGSVAHAQQTLGVDDLAKLLQNCSGDCGQAGKETSAPETLSKDEMSRLLKNRLVVEQAGKKSANGESFSLVERKKIASIANQPGYAAVDMEIYFDYNSAAIAPKAAATLVRLGQALSSDALSGKTFLIAGHTDASGSDGYNLSLSQKRAQSVRQFLMDAFRLTPNRLIAIGYGEEQLKRPATPDADENRRVQIVNLSR